MSRNTVLQLIAAVITIAVLVGIHQSADWFLSRMSTGYIAGFLSGCAFIFLIWFLAERQGRSRAGGDIRAAEQQSARHTIDL